MTSGKAHGVKEEKLCSLMMAALNYLGVFGYFKNDFLNKYIVAVYFLIIIIAAMASLITIFKFMRYIEILTHAILYLSFNICVMMKLGAITANRDQLKSLFERFNGDLLRLEKSFEIPANLSTNGAEKKVDWYIKFCWGYGLVIICTFSSAPVLDRLFLGSHPVQNITESSGFVEILPLKEWWPIDVTRSPGYELSYIFHVLDICVHVIFFLSISTICYGIVFLVTNRFKILQHVFENIKEVSINKVLSGINIAPNNDAVDINGLTYRDNGSSNEITPLKSLREMKECPSIVEEEDEIGLNQNYPNIPIFKSASSPMTNQLLTNNKDKFLKGLEQSRIHGQTMETVRQRFSLDTEEKINRQMMDDLKTAIQYHQSLLSSCRELETLINPILGADMLILLVVLCVSGFQLSLPEAIDVMNNIELLIVITGLSLVFCSLVDELSLQSKSIGRSLYESDWLDTPQSYKKNLLIVMTCSQRPVALTMVKCSTVTVVSFSTILQRAYSNFTILRDVNSR